MDAKATVTRPRRALRESLVWVATLVFVLLGLGPRTGWYQTLTVLTGSMSPTIPAGSVVIVRPEPMSELRVGDVLVFKDPRGRGETLTHRVQQIEPGDAGPVVVTRGDANGAADPPTRLVGDTAWTVRSTLPKLGFVLQWLRLPAVRLLTVVVSPLLFVIVTLLYIWRPARPGAQDVPVGVRLAQAVVGPPPVWYLQATGQQPAPRAVVPPRPAWMANALEPGDTDLPAGAGGRRLGTLTVATLVAVVVFAAPAAALFADFANANQTVSTIALAPPTGAGATSINCVAGVSVKVRLTFTDAADAFTTQYRVYRKAGAGPESLVTTRPANMPRATVTWDDTGVTFSTTYTYRVESFRTPWFSATSATAVVTTPSTLCLGGT